MSHGQWRKVDVVERIERGEALKPESVRLMKEVLLRQEFNDEIPAGVPKGTPVAHRCPYVFRRR